jgi:hypothetical protein
MRVEDVEGSIIERIVDLHAAGEYDDALALAELVERYFVARTPRGTELPYWGLAEDVARWPRR